MPANKLRVQQIYKGNKAVKDFILTKQSLYRFGRKISHYFSLAKNSPEIK
jgi:hypothetical protein